MPFARPDKSWRREPMCPGRHFGSSSARTLRTICTTSIVLLVTTASAGLAEEPISLSNDDVARLHANETKAPATTPNGTVAADTQTRAEADALAQKMDADLKARLDRISQRSMGNLARQLDDRAVSAVSAGPRPAPTQSTFSDEPSGLPAAPAPRDDAGEEDEADTETGPTASVQGPRPEPVAACMYGTRGQLLHAPDGKSCAKVRQGRLSHTYQSHSESTASKSRAKADEGQVGCVYGSRGQLLYASPGVECGG